MFRFQRPPGHFTHTMMSESGPERIEGVVAKSTGSHYEVLHEGGTSLARMRGRFRLTHNQETNPLAVGDKVTLVVQDESATIEAILPRSNRLVRRAAGRRVGLEHVLAANVDFAWVIQSTFLPKLNPGLVDRFLVMAGREDIPAGIIINKCDLITDTSADAIAFWADLYRGIGYPVLMTSATTGEGVDEIRRLLGNKTSVFVGASGVGKSSLVNAIDPTLDIRTGLVSEKTKKGKHITTNATLYSLAGSGRLIDTPGLREYGVVDIEAWELGHYFVEFQPFVQSCRFPTCTHDHEPDCAVVEAVERGEISDVRWASYLNILSSIHQGEADTGR